MIVPRIDRNEKNQMRLELEKVAIMYNDIKLAMEESSNRQWSEGYTTLWQELIKRNNEMIVELKKSMIIKCNR